MEFGRAPVSRLIVIEDADHLGSRRQPYLRRMMESESHTTRFIFTARAPSRIIDALRSRMQHIRIPAIESEEIVATVGKVASLENITLAAGLAEDIAHVETPMGLIGVRIRIARKEKFVPEFELRGKTQAEKDEEARIKKEADDLAAKARTESELIELEEKKIELIL